MINDPTPTEFESQAQQDAQYYREILHGLIDMGADLARLVHQQAMAAAPADDAASAAERGPDFTISFDRIARAVRRTVVLARRVAEPVQESHVRSLLAARRTITRAVEDSIFHDAPDDEADDLQAEFDERLAGSEFDDDLAVRPIDDIIKDVRRDLGLAAQPGARVWKRRTPADIKLLHERAAAPCDQAAGPFVLPMPPRGWTGGVRTIGVARSADASRIRGP